jgi:hypothetical protein
MEPTLFHEFTPCIFPLWKILFPYMMLVPNLINRETIFSVGMTKGNTMKIEPIRYYGGITEDHVIQFEQRIGARLPEEYRYFLIRYNGGKFQKKWFTIFNHFTQENEQFKLRYFLGIPSQNNKRHTDMNIPSAFDDLLTHLPSQLMVIATDSGGASFCLAIRGEHYGKIYFGHDETIYMYIKSHEALRDINNFFG